MERYVCIHGHFYQPPRENPWLEYVELQDSAYPYHDWNDRITAECYGPNTAARLLDAHGRIVNIVNNFSRISFNVGPTLMAWMQRHNRGVHDAIVEADRRSRELFGGHGSALAQVYNHMIMPLANRRDKETQVRWGIHDFRQRFGREPEGIWLPETAVDIETLEVLAAHGIAFTILAPRQAKRYKQIAKGARWHDARGGIDPSRAYLCPLPSGKQIVLFFYDGPIAQDMAFGNLLDNGEHFARRLLGAFDDSRTHTQLVHVATDGESYGHHRRYGEMALAYCLHYIETAGIARITNYGKFLEDNTPEYFAEIWDNSSWSCAHGVERWQDNCGCNSGRAGWTQEWRKPLREALDQLRDSVRPLFEHKAAKYFPDPWQARDDYIAVVNDRSPETIAAFLQRNARRPLDTTEQVRALKLLELQRNCMLMYTSCGWFFDEISGIETVQVLQYAAAAVQYAEQLFERPFEQDLLARLEQAPSNVLPNGAEAYRLYAKPSSLDLTRVGAHWAIASLFTERPRSNLYCYSVMADGYQRADAGRFKLALGQIAVTSHLTQESRLLSFAVFHLGDHNVAGGVRDFQGAAAFDAMAHEILAAFERGNITAVMQLTLRHFGDNNYSVWHLFKDEQRRILEEVLQDSLGVVELSLQQIYESNSAVMNFLHDLRQPVPPPIYLAAEYTTNAALRRLLEAAEPDLQQLIVLTQHVRKWSFKLDADLLQFAAAACVAAAMARVAAAPTDSVRIEFCDNLLTVLEPLHLNFDLWKPQNILFFVAREHMHAMRERAADGDRDAARWMAAVTQLGGHLNVKVDA